MTSIFGRLIPLVALACGTAAIPEAEMSDPGTCDASSLSEAWGRYVEPFVSGAVTSSCTECHLTGIDVSIYAQDTPCATLACMVDLGAVDLDDPDSSQILAQIRLGDPQSSVYSVDAEVEAMREWIRWGATCAKAVCGEIEDACTSGTGAASTGRTPLGDCSEEDLLGAFWDAVIVDRGRCAICHASFGVEAGTFGPCASVDDCEGEQVCAEGFCRAPGPWAAPHFFEGVEGPLAWTDPADRDVGRRTMYNVLALGLVDAEEPLDSLLLTKPLLEGFQPTAVFGPGIEVTEIPEGVGAGGFHGGTSKFNFGCHTPPCPTEGVVDCRVDVRCGDRSCPDGRACVEGYCREPGSVCDPTYARFVRFTQYNATCR